MSIFDSFMSALGLAQPDPDAEQIAPMVLVKILDSVAFTGIDQGSTLTLDQLKTQAAAPDSAAYTALAAKFPGLVLGWAFTSFTAADLTALIGRATAADPSYEAPKFDHFFEIVCDLNFDTDGLAAALTAWSDVIDYAYVAGDLSDPVITGAGNPLFAAGDQGYFAAAPAGIDVAAAWAKGADGTGIDVIDIERGWYQKHEDLPVISILGGANLTASLPHGTAVMGIIAGQDNTLGIIGAAPAANVTASSYHDQKPGVVTPVNVPRVHDRIANAAVILAAGSVLLLEVQITKRISGLKTLLPVEADAFAFEAVKLATTAGLIVIEAAGNFDTSLDNWVMDVGPRKGKKTLAQSTPADFADSGAIMVGACAYAPPRNRWPHSNFGSRVDCYSWGEQIYTSTWDPAHPAATNAYYGVNVTQMVSGKPVLQYFGGTSGASPVIVGCAVLMQHLSGLLTRQDGKTGKFDPVTMRKILSDPINGTSCVDPIGVMPDFQKLLANIFAP